MRKGVYSRLTVVNVHSQIRGPNATLKYNKSLCQSWPSSKKQWKLNKNSVKASIHFKCDTKPQYQLSEFKALRVLQSR